MIQPAEDSAKAPDDMPLALAIDDDPELRLRLGRYLGGIRKLRKIAQDEVARALKISRPHLSNIEQGRSRTGWTSLRNMAEFYGLGIQQLIHEVDDKLPREPVIDGHQRLTTVAIDANVIKTFQVDDGLLLGLFHALEPADQLAILGEINELVQARLQKLRTL